MVVAVTPVFDHAEAFGEVGKDVVAERFGGQAALKRFCLGLPAGMDQFDVMVRGPLVQCMADQLLVMRTCQFEPQRRSMLFRYQPFSD